MRRFWQTARGFWHRPTAWALMAMLAVCVILQLIVQYRLNFWNRDFFNALEARDGRQIWHQARVLAALAASSVTLAIIAVWGRMTFQRLWRDWLTHQLITSWLADQRYQRLGFVNGQRQNPEYRITEDARLATDAPIDLVVGLLSSVLAASVFIVVLWNVGGALEIRIWGGTIAVPGYLVIASVVYASTTTLGMMVIGRNMVEVIENKNQAEADFKYVVARVNTRATLAPQPEDASILATAQTEVIHQWKRLCGQHMRTTLVSHGNTLLAPVVGLLFCAPNYVAGTVSLGEVTQAAAAFVSVQGAFNWLVDNYPRLAEWLSSAYRVGILLKAFDELDGQVSASMQPETVEIRPDPQPT
ncbi:ABC transporter transmembrane region 2 [Enhydrobacter aerosaccus]|uniref:ABC transporter transmembrane region 2 n=2 Tax=Enhydrobacter aerosaccus TaxID=225324 RepID=A0A1T4R9X7_9HYPH|nr:ABC transporter transmembrane region 2 [Enhydrobacter aerosaccus]